MKARLLAALLACPAAASCQRHATDPLATAENNDCTKYERVFCAKVDSDSQECKSIREISAFLPRKACAAALADLPYTEAKIAEMRRPCNDLIERLCRDVGAQSDSCQMVRQRTPGFPAGRCAMMLAQYASVLGEIRKAEAKNEPLGDADQKRLVAGATTTFGPADAAIELVEFSDFQCPFCARTAQALTALKARYGGKVLVVFRQFPLEIHSDAHLAAQASLAAGAQGKFWEFHDQLFESQAALKREHLEISAKRLGLNMLKFKKALDDGTYKVAVDRDIALGKSVAVEGTPTVFLNGKRLAKVGEAAALAQAIDAELSR